MPDIPESIITAAVGAGVAVLWWITKTIRASGFGTFGAKTTEFALALVYLASIILGMWLTHQQGPQEISVGHAIVLGSMWLGGAIVLAVYSYGRSRFKSVIAANGKAPDNGRLTK